MAYEVIGSGMSFVNGVPQAAKGPPFRLACWFRRARAASLGLLVLLVLTSSGCHPHRVAPTPKRVLPSTNAVSLRLATVEGTSSMLSRFKLEVKSGSRTARFDGELVANQALGLRFQLSAPVGPPLAYGALSSDEGSLYLPYSENTFYYTRDPSALIRRMSRDRLELADILSVMLGWPPPCAVQGAVRHAQADDTFRVQCQPADAARPPLELILEPGDLSLLGVEARGLGPAAPPPPEEDEDEEGAPRSTARFRPAPGMQPPPPTTPAPTLEAEPAGPADIRLRLANPIPVGDAQVSQELVVVLSGLELTLHLVDPEPAPNLTESMFKLERPSGASSRVLESLVRDLERSSRRVEGSGPQDGPAERRP